MLIRPMFTVIHTEVIKVNLKENKINISPSSAEQPLLLHIHCILDWSSVLRRLLNFISGKVIVTQTDVYLSNIMFGIYMLHVLQELCQNSLTLC